MRISQVVPAIHDYKTRPHITIAHTMTPFYGEAAAQKFLGLLEFNYGAVRAYSEATVARDTRQQHAALARLESNADDIADFLSHLNPYLQRDIIGG